MKCDECDQKATVFYSSVDSEGEIDKSAFCDRHAAEKGVADPQSVMMMELLEAFQQHQGEAGEVDLSDIEELAESCPACGFTLESLRKIGRLGCPECYRTFGAELAERLRVLHRGSSHTGRSPQGWDAGRAAREELLSELEDKLAEAVGEENYEEAAKLKKEISGLKADAANLTKKEEKN